ncbi:putative reverse transcriptase domain-containing protein [Tanacetum coccineum]|uniref:Reverse transcriptase domain-containing protein n=1 Tax=Tanacetum coccineum TaxID=301880 RepID=A0ABQ4WY21_9ASTR
MSDSEDSTVTYTTVSSPFESLSDIGSSGVDEPPMMLEDPYAYVVAAFQAPPSPDYVLGLEEPEQAPPLPEFVPEPVYQNSDPKEDEEDPEEDPIDYPTNRDDDDDDEEEPSGDEADDEEEDEDDEEEEEEHPALADSIPPPVHCVTARISIRAQTPVSLPSDTEVSRLLAIHTPPPSPLSPWSSPLPQIPSPPLLVSSPVPVSPPPLPASPTYPLGYRAAMIQLRAETPSTSHPLPLPSPIILPHTRASEPKQAPPSPVYVPYVPDPAYPEFMPPEEEILLAKEQPLPAALSPTADLPGYVPEDDPKEDLEEDDDEDPEEDPTDYPANGGDNGDDEDKSSDDDEDGDVDIEEEEEEHLAPADSIAIDLPAVDHAPSAEETEPFEIDESVATPPPHPAYWVTARISIRDKTPTPFWSNTEVARLLAIPTLSPSPLSPWSSPLPLILSPLPVSSPPPASPTYPLGYRAAMIRLRAEAPSISHSPLPHIILSHTRADTPPSGTPPLLPIPLPTSSPYLLLPSADHGADMAEVCLPPWKRLCFAFGPRYEVGESSSAAFARPTGGFRTNYGFVATIDREIRHDLDRDVDYRITDTWEEILVDMPGEPVTDDTELGRRMTEFATRVRQDTDEIYVRLDDEQTERQQMVGRLNMLYRDRRAHAHVILLRTTVLGQQAMIKELQAADRRRQAAITLLLEADRRRQAQFFEALKLLKILQSQMIEFESQQGPTKGPAQPDAPEEAAPKRATRSNTAPKTTNITSVTNAQLLAMIDQGVTAALAARDADRNTKGDDSHNSGTGELALLCGRMFPEESDKIEKYVGGLPDMIYGSVVASKPKTMQEAIEITTELMDKKIRTFVERQTESKRKQDDNHQQQQLNKRQNTGRAYTAGTGEKKQYRGSKPLCLKCNYHHDGPCAPRCHKCNKVGHVAHDCRSTANANNAINQRGTGSGQKPTCYECGAQGHFKRDCPKLKNNNRGNQGRNGNASTKVYAVGRVGTNPYSNVMTGTFLLNNCYASVLFDTGADRSFVSTAFSS